ncbi:MAG: ROK family protein [Propioniciclava sp.]
MTPLTRLDDASRRILGSLVRCGPLPRADLAGETGLSSGSVTRLTRTLLARGFVRELAPRIVTVGRPSVPLEALDTAGSFVGFKLVPGRLYGVRTGLTGHIQDRFQQSIDTRSAESAAEEITTVVVRLNQEHPVDAVGVGLAAAVDSHGGLRAADLLGWQPGGNLQAAVSEQSGVACTSTNDVDGFTLGEHWLGAGRGSRRFVVLTIGAGIGTGVVIGDALIPGHGGAAAMLGSAWLPDGRSFHPVLRDTDIAERVGVVTGSPLTYAEALAHDSAAAHRELDDAVTALGHLVGLATIAYGPDRVLLSGEGIPLVHGRSATLMRAFSSHRFADMRLPEVIVKETSPYRWARGAAVAAIQNTLLPQTR